MGLTLFRRGSGKKNYQFSLVAPEAAFQRSMSSLFQPLGIVGFNSHLYKPKELRIGRDDGEGEFLKGKEMLCRHTAEYFITGILLSRLDLEETISLGRS